MSRSRKSPLVSESRDALDKFKLEVAKDLGRLQFTKEHNDHYKGNVTARQNGSEGGPIGGEMVRRMIKKAEDDIKNRK
jgi:hypothetical protein